MGYEFEKKYAIESYDFDRFGKVKVTSIFNALQDISTVHFKHATKDLEESNSGIWVIVEWDVEIVDRPSSPCEVTVITEPTYFRKFIAYRKYTIKNSENKILATAISKWAYLDMALRKNSSIPAAFNEVFGVEPKADKPKKMSIDLENLILQAVSNFKSYDSDLDVNQHVNNVVYVRWAMDALNMAKKWESSSNEVKRVKVSYKKETFEGESINVETCFSENEKRTVHLLNNSMGERCVEIEFEY